MERVLEVEWLDELPAGNPEAIQSRRDLRRVNFFMGHTGILARGLAATRGSQAPRHLLEIGAGDGTFLLAAARRLARRWPGVQVTLLDRQALVRPETVAGFEGLGWTARLVTDDVFRWLEQSEGMYDTVVANLFLHHFSEPQLGGLLRGLAKRSRSFIAIEPRRAALPLGMSRLLWLIGCNRVTRHDAVASVRAGFAGNELSGSWPTDGSWRVSERRAGLFSHMFSAEAGRV
jgi:hypothetical protein